MPDQWAHGACKKKQNKTNNKTNALNFVKFLLRYSLTYQWVIFSWITSVGHRNNDIDYKLMIKLENSKIRKAKDFPQSSCRFYKLQDTYFYSATSYPRLSHWVILLLAVLFDKTKWKFRFLTAKHAFLFRYNSKHYIFYAALVRRIWKYINTFYCWSSLFSQRCCLRKHWCGIHSRDLGSMQISGLKCWTKFVLTWPYEKKI